MKLHKLAIIGLVSTLGLSGCGTKTIKKSSIEQQAQIQFDAISRAKGSGAFPKITCPSDLDAKVGATTRCSATGTDGTLGITATVSSIDGNKAHLRFKGDNQVTK
jgi:hypothetical protein